MTRRRSARRSAALEAAGYVAESASTGRQCLKAVGARPPDLITLDIGLPDLDGWQVLGLLNEWGYDVPVRFSLLRPW